MNDVLLGRKYSEKDLSRAMARLTPHLQFGEVPVCAVRARGGKPLIDTLMLTNQRIIAMYKRGNDQLEFAYPISDVRRLAFQDSALLIRTPDDEVLEICHVWHDREDIPLIRQAFSSIGGQIDGEAGIVRDPTEGLQRSPRTKEKAIHEGVKKIDTYLADDEQLLYALQDIADWYFITNRRLIVLTGIWKTQAKEMDLSDYIRVEVEQDGQKWLVAAADAQQEYALIGKLNKEDEARWLAAKLESAYPHMADTWRDDLRDFVDSIGLSYAFEAIFPMLWPPVEGEQLLSAFGGGEELLIFTTRRLVALPDLSAASIQDVVEIQFAVGRSEHYAYTGILLNSAIGMTCDVRLADGRRFHRVQFIGSTEQEYNAAIPSITRALNDLRQAGYPVTEGQEWVEQTQNPPPRQGPTSFVGFSVEF